MTTYEQLDAWIDAHFDEQVRFLQELIRVPTDTPPGNNAPHAERTAELLHSFGFEAEKHAVPEAEVHAAGLQSITNLVVRRTYGEGRTVRLNAQGLGLPDTVPSWGSMLQEAANVTVITQFPWTLTPAVARA